MANLLKSGWSKPSTILFAAAVPANEKAFQFALAQARQFNADLVLFHAYDSAVLSTSETSGVRYNDYAATARAEKEHLEPLAQRVREAGLRCEIIIRPGMPEEQILAYSAEREIDRIVMGTHAPGPISKLLVGSVAEAVVRSAPIPVFIAGPEVVSGVYRDFAIRTILCAVNLTEASAAVATFAAELAAQHQARLILQHVIRPQDRAEVLAGRSLDDIETALQNLISSPLRESAGLETIVVPGDPTEELLYQGRAQQADLIVLGAQGASAFAAITRNGIVYKTLAHSQCPVMTLSPVVLAAAGSRSLEGKSPEQYMAGVV